MSVWTWSLMMGLGIGFALFALILLPLLLIQYRRYGRLTAKRLIGSAAVAVYAAGLLSFTMLPLPAPGELDCSDGSAIQLHPFQFVSDIREQTASLSTASALTSHVVLQVVFNVVLFLPWGILARGFYKRGILLSTVTALLASLFIEASQYTGLWGIYPCAYRLADVDDLIANTFGGFLGALLAPLVLAWMPSSTSLRRDRGGPRPVSAGRRLLGMLVDWTAINALLVGTAVVTRMVLLALDLPHDDAAADGLILWLGLGAGLVYVVVPVVTGATRGSAGQTLLWLAPVRRVGQSRQAVPLGAGRGLVRAMSVAGLYVVFRVLGVELTGNPWFAAADLLFALWMAANALSVFFTRGRRGLSYALAGADLADSRTLRPAAEGAARRPE